MINNPLQELISTRDFDKAYKLVRTLDKNDPMIKPNNGIDPFLTCCYFNKKNLILALLEKGADINSRDARNNKTALMVAITKGSNKDLATSFLLLEQGADPSIADIDNNSPLIHAIFCRETLLAKKLIDKGADLNHLDKEGQTALSIACINNLVEIFYKLLENGANPNIKLKSGKTVIFHSKFWKFTEALIKYGTDINIKDNDGKTVLDYTSKKSMKYDLIQKVVKEQEWEKDWEKEKKIVTNAKNLIKRRYKTLPKIGFKNQTK